MEPPAKKAKRSSTSKPTAGKRQRSSTASPPAKRTKVTDKGKRGVTKASKNKTSDTRKKATPSNVLVAMSPEVIAIITEKLKQEIEQMRPDKILTLLEILSRIAVNASTLKDVPVMNCLQTLMTSSQLNRTITQHATRIHKTYIAVVKAHQSEMDPSSETPQASSSKDESTPAKPSSEEKSDDVQTDSSTVDAVDGDATMTDEPSNPSEESTAPATTTPSTEEKKEEPTPDAPSAPSKETESSEPGVEATVESTPDVVETAESSAPSKETESSEPAVEATVESTPVVETVESSEPAVEVTPDSAPAATESNQTTNDVSEAPTASETKTDGDVPMQDTEEKPAEPSVEAN